jgi:halocyanin-like protein
MRATTRRTALRTAATAAFAGLAGCAGGGDGGGETTVPGSEHPAVDEWLTETEIGPAADNYGGALVDRRDRDAVTVDVGVEGNRGNFAYGPPAVVVSAGTEVRWSWTGEGNPHNVEALPREQLGESDYTFSSGAAEGGSGVRYRRTLAQPGVALYHCEPHLSLGMKGGVAVE